VAHRHKSAGVFRSKVAKSPGQHSTIVFAQGSVDNMEMGGPFLNTGERHGGGVWAVLEGWQ
jgi:hypothetical protein